jgi:hypothetical protein
MNILVDRLPEEVEVGGKSYKIDADFKTCLRIVLALEDNDLTAYEKQGLVLALLYRGHPPGDVAAAVKAAQVFLNAGREAVEARGPRVYSLTKDADLVYAAFRQTHGIDLAEAEMHWWKFMALFMDLGADTVFCNLVSLRGRVKTGRATKEERRLARDLGDLMVVPDLDDRTLEEREAEFKFMMSMHKGE